MPFIDVDDLEWLEDLFENYYQTPIAIYAPVADPDGYDDSAQTWADEPTTTVDGWFRKQPDFALNDDFSALHNVEDGRLFVPLGTELARGYKVVVSDEEYLVVETNNTNTYRVTVRASVRRLG